MQSKDELLVKKAIEGDRYAFGQLIEKYQNAVYGLAYHLVRDSAEAQDLCQEAFLQAYLKLQQLKQPAKFASWLKRITANICKMWLRRPKPELVSWEELKEDELQVDASYEAEEIKQDVREAIDALSEKNRLTITLYYIDGLTQKEIGDFLGVPLGSIKSRLHEAKKHLRKELTERGYFAPVTTMVKESLQAEKLPDDFRLKLEEMLESTDAVIRRKAVHQLQEYHRKDQTVDDLIIKATKDDNREVRERAVQALGRIRCEKAIPLLAEYLKDANPQVRKRAEWSLNRIGTEQVVDEVLKLLDCESWENEAPAEVRRHAVDVLKGICPEKAAPRLIRALHEDDDVSVRERIIQVLSSVKDDSVAQELVQLLWDNEQRIRQTAMDALREMKPVNVAPTLMNALDDENIEIQRQAVELLGILRHKDAESKLIQKLDSSDPTVVFKAAEALGEMKSEKALEPLMSLLQHRERMLQRTSETCRFEIITSTSADVGASVAKALGLINDKAAIPALMEFFEYLISLKSPRTHDSTIGTIWALGQIGDEQVAHRLAQYLSEIAPPDDSILRNWPGIPIRPLVRALAWIGSPVAVPHLAKVVDYDYFIGEETSGALGQLGPEAIPVLKQVLAQSESPHKRWRAAKSLSEIRHSESLEPLLAALKDDEPQVRYHVARALGALGNQDAIPFLKDALQDEHHGVRKEAMRALKSLSVPESELPQIADKLKSKKESQEVSSERFLEERRLPTKDSLRRAILEKFVTENFEAGKVYQEKEVNEIISRAYDDYCSVRRYFVDYRMMSRDRGRYWVTTLLF
ncbi:sigma-70 family RNA polymerase sigma factor [Candidatus Poribacteria bacterium]|nr:sigma-70 family RNA polymerase sigma factor [Candidatus Poribacteria bacterium]